MEFYLDDCADADRLVADMIRAGHHVVTPRSAGTLGHDDDEHLAYAIRHGLTLITKNPHDFRHLHEEWRAQGRNHDGILLICEDNIRGKDMEPPDIVAAVANLLKSGVPIANEIHVLNHWR